MMSRGKTKQAPKTELSRSQQDVCRTCLSSEKKLTNIFKVMFEEINLTDIFKNYIGLQVHPEDSLPKGICEVCLFDLCRVYTFINNCKQTERKLNSLIICNLKEVIEVKAENADLKPNPKLKNTVEVKLKSGPEDKEVETDLFKQGPIKIEEDGPPFQCNCKQTFETLEGIKLHRRKLRRCRNIKQYLCRVCNPSKLYSARGWMAHMETHKRPYQCEICGKTFGALSNQIRHVKVHTGERLYVCDVCGKRFTRTTGLKLHKQKYHAATENSRKGTLREFYNIHKEYSCDECGTVLKNLASYRKHMNVEHDLPQYVCQVCGKRYANLASLHKHLIVHSKKRAHKCNVCHKSFVQRAHLITHMNLHTGEKQYVCPYCGKRFAINGNLTVHKRRHTGEKPYKCNICDKGFYDSSSMKVHRRRH